MPTRCIAAGCSKTTKDGVSLHLFPADPKYRRLWAAKVRLTRAKWSGPTSFSALCSEHFEPSCFESGIHHSFDMTRRAILKHDAVPTIFPASGKSKKVSERRNVRGPDYKFSLQISRLEIRHEQRPLGSGPTRKFVNTIKTNIFKP